MAKIREINECSLDKIAALITTPTAATVQTQSNTPYTAIGIKSSKTENKGAAKMNIEEIAKHADWYKKIREKYANINEGNADKILRDEIGIVFSEVLTHAGVFKRDEKGQAAFDKFAETL